MPELISNFKFSFPNTLNPVFLACLSHISCVIGGNYFRITRFVTAFSFRLIKPGSRRLLPPSSLRSNMKSAKMQMTFSQLGVTISTFPCYDNTWEIGDNDDELLNYLNNADVNRLSRTK